MNRVGWYRLLGLIALVLWVNLFLFQELSGFGFALFIAGVITGLIWLLWWNKITSKVLKGWLMTLLLVCVGIGILAWRSSEMVVIIYLISLVILTTLMVYEQVAQTVRFRAFFEFISWPVRLMSSWFKAFTKWPRLIYVNQMKSNLTNQFWKQVSPIVAGLVVGIPIAYLLVLLLSQADPIFAAKVPRLSSIYISQDLVVRLVLSLFVIALLAPVMAMKLNKKFLSPMVRTFSRDYLTFLNTVIIIVAAILLSFIVVEWPYIFATVAAETDLSAFGVATFSEYVTKGFGELLLVSVVVYAVMGGHLVIWRGVKPKSTKSLYLTIILGIIFFVFLVSIFRRVWLYQLFHGSSLIRIYGILLLVGISGMSALLLGRYFQAKNWVSAELGLIILLVAGLGVWNTENYIAVSSPPTVNGQVDYVYLSRLSADGYAGWVKAFDWVSQTVESDMMADGVIDQDERRQLSYAGLVIGNLDENRFELVEKYGTSEQKYHLYQEYFSNRLKIIEIQKRSQFISDELGYVMEGLEQEYDRVATEASQLSLEVVNDRRVSAYSNSFYSRKHMSFDWEYGCHYSACIQGFSVMGVLGGWGESETIWDRVLTLNISKKQAYEKWGQDITKEEWDQTVALWLELYARVLTQEDRDFNTDISVLSPLL
jgi:hypothetical protein